jgi:site-specific DNA-methyltransferase (adenine-specific)
VKYCLYNGDCLDVLASLTPVACIFADPPDNIGLGYGRYRDRLPEREYIAWLSKCLHLFVQRAGITWLSFNARWTCQVGRIACELQEEFPRLETKPCVQVFTFGQHSHRDLGNNHRPLWRFRWPESPLHPDQIRVPSWRQRNGDKRADRRGRVPGDVFDHQYPGLGDVFDFPRITGNSKQKCDWHPTQLHEELVERCIKLSTEEGETVLDPFGGTGTTMRVCRRIERGCTLIEIDGEYCRQIAEKQELARSAYFHKPIWESMTGRGCEIR